MALCKNAHRCSNDKQPIIPADPKASRDAWQSAENRQDKGIFKQNHDILAEKRPKKPSPASKPGFEDTLKRLEEIVHLLEEGEIGLDQALARYEEGVRLLRDSYDLLEHAESRIELLSGVDAQGNPVSQKFDDRQTESSDEGRRRRPLPE